MVLNIIIINKYEVIVGHVDLCLLSTQARYGFRVLTIVCVGNIRVRFPKDAPLRLNIIEAWKKTYLGKISARISDFSHHTFMRYANLHSPLPTISIQNL
jgi:hypothetical protein